MRKLAEEMIRIEGLSIEQLLQERKDLAGTMADAPRPASDQAEADVDHDPTKRAEFLRTYVTEVLVTRLDEAKTPDEQFTYQLVADNYQKVVNSSYGAQAHYRIGVLGMRDKLGAGQNDQHAASAKIGKEALKTLKNQYKADPGLLGGFTAGKPIAIWVRYLPGKGPNEPALAGEGGVAALAVNGATASATTPAFQAVSAPLISTEMLDTLYHDPAIGVDYWYYQSVDKVFGLFRGFAPKGLAPIFGLIGLALLVKLLTWPLTSASYKGMREMQRIQPLIKELQERYKDDKPKFAEEQMKLMKEHKVSAFGGCLPMLVQIPFFIVVYQAVLVYANNFNVPFLWVPTLSEPDGFLLLLYLISMVLTQWLTAQPSADPQQKSMQNMMTIVMPLMLAMVLKTMPSAFILYWFTLNVFSSAHQYYLRHKLHEEEVNGTLVPELPTSARGKSLAGSPSQKRGK
jgi:YidC/Oxa1 family membrane protein insertase